MREMVIGKENFLPVDAQLRLQRARDPEFVEHPADHGLAKHLPGSGVGLENAHQQAIEFAERPLVEDDVVQVLGVKLSLAQAKTDGVRGKTEVVLDPGKAFFFGRGDELPVAQERSRSIVVIAGNSENMHQLLSFGPAQVMNFRGMLNPLRRAMLDAKRIGEQPDDEAKWQDDNPVKESEQHARLEIADLVREPLPGAPKIFQTVRKGIGHSCRASPRTARRRTAQEPSSGPE